MSARGHVPSTPARALIAHSLLHSRVRGESALRPHRDVTLECHPPAREAGNLVVRNLYITAVDAGVSMSIPLIPVPNHLENRGGAAFALSGETKIFADPDSQAAVELFVTHLRRATGFDLEVQPLTANNAGGAPSMGQSSSGSTPRRTTQTVAGTRKPTESR